MPDRSVPAAAAASELFTVGHSVLSLDSFLDIVRGHRIALLVDVRRLPRSRRHPHFGRPALASSAAAAGVEYQWVEALGGRRSRVPGSPHQALPAAFAGYADHMETAEFEAAAFALADEAAARRTAILCAEADPADCHRSLIADWFTVRRWRVCHLTSASELHIHELHPAVRRDGERIIYDRGQIPLGI